MGVVADLEFDPYSLQCLEDPYPVYRALLEDAPLYHREKRGFVLDTLLPLIPEFSVSGPVKWMSTPGDRGIESLPVRK